LREIRLYISRTDRRVQFKNAIGEFFNPHDSARLEKAPNFAFAFKAGIIAPEAGHWEANLFILRTNYFAFRISLRKST